MYNLFDVVKIRKALSGKDRFILERGSEGTILEIYSRGKEVGYNVEFMDSLGNTTAVLVVDEADIEPIEATASGEDNNVVAFRREKKVTPTNKNKITTYRSAITGKFVAAKATRANGTGKTTTKVAAKAGKKAATPKPKKPPTLRTK